MNLDFFDLIDDNFVTLDIPPRFGLLFSGGADSSLLAYILASYRSPNPYYIFTVLRHNVNIERCFRIIDWINKETNNKLIGPIIVGNPNVIHSRQVLSGFLEIKKKYNITHIFDGSTKNPDHLDSIGPKRKGLTDPSTGIIVPFGSIDKRYIIQYYKNHNLQGLLKLTHSCGNDPLVSCGKCFNCLEKNWAIETSI
jgi:hypothetical protein